MVERGLTQLPIDPFEIARTFEIDVQGVNLDGASGVLLYQRNQFSIAFAKNVVSTGSQRFSVAHELGHYYLPGHHEALFAKETIHLSKAGFASSDTYEREADNFAAGLLMPRALFVTELARNGGGLDGILGAAARCETSRTATAIRYTQCSDEPVAMVLSCGRTIDYCFMSEALRSRQGLEWIRKNAPIPKGTVTYRFNEVEELVRKAKRSDGVSDLRLWFGGDDEIEVTEEVVGLGSHGKTLTILRGFEFPEEEEEEDEAALDDSWTPRFRR